MVLLRNVGLLSLSFLMSALVNVVPQQFFSAAAPDTKQAWLASTLVVGTLASLLGVEVARRVGLSANGVAFPGHFLVRVDDPEDVGTFVIVDCFSGGTIMGVADLQAMLSKQAGRGVTLSPRMLEPAGARVILLRMLRNLKAAYTERSDYARALLAQERLMVLTGDEPGEVRDHGLLLAGAREPGSAISQLTRYAQLSPDADDLVDIQRTIKMLRDRAFNVQ